jgi:hypothetical protein
MGGAADYKLHSNENARELAILAAVLCFSGCATAAQRQAQQIRENSTSAILDFKTCEDAVWNSPEYAPLQRHSPLNLRDATIDQMMDSSKATPEEIAAIKAPHPQIVACRNTFLDRINLTTPTISTIFVENWDARDSYLIDLLQLKITWGKLLTESKTRAAEEHKKVLAEGKNIDANLQQSHEAELARRQTAAKAMTDYLQTQEMIDAMNRPVITNCSGFGNSVNCVSR